MAGQLSSYDFRARRFAADDVVPKKWFATKQGEFKALLKTPHRQSITDWPWVLLDKVNAYLIKFQSEFEAMVTNYQARRLMDKEVRSAQEYIKTLSAKFDTLKKVTWPYLGYDETRDPVRHLQFFGWVEASSQVERDYPVIGDIFKYEWAFDEAALDRLVKKTLKAATPDEIDAIMGNTDRASHVRFDFLTRTGFYKAAVRLLKKTKLEWSPIAWFTKTREIFEASYAPEVTPAYRDFDLHGMKIVVDDSTVSDQEIRDYIGYLKEAHARLRIRGLESAWYGTCFIKCEACGGVNQNTAGGVGGHYFIEPDTVRIYSRPSIFIVELVVHELGHRYWFKQMRPEQRHRFTELVKARTVPRPSGALKGVQLYSETDLRKYRGEIRRARQSMLQLINEVREGRISLDDNEDFRKQFRGHPSDIYEAIVMLRVRNQGIDDAFKDPSVEALKKQVWSEHVTVKWKGDEIERLPPDRLVAWAQEATRMVNVLADKATETLDLALKVANAEAEAKLAEHPASKAWQQSYLDNPAPVEAVSSYGKSNIDEAFAEVFAHYVLNYDITRDQMESFRSVLSERGSHRRGAVVERVADRFLAAVV